MSVDYVICACRERYNVKKHGTLIAISVQSIAPLMDGIDNRRVKLSDLPILKQTFEEVSSEDVTIGTTLTICTQHWKGLSKKSAIDITLYGAQLDNTKLVVFRFILQRADSTEISAPGSSDKVDTLMLVPISSPTLHSQYEFDGRFMHGPVHQAGLLSVYVVGDGRIRGRNFVCVCGGDIVIKKLNDLDIDDCAIDDMDFYSGACAYTKRERPGIITVLRFD